MKPEQQFTPLKILLADDDPDDRYFFEEALKDFVQPTDLIVVQDGEQLILENNFIIIISVNKDRRIK
jgi:CheY-like chemotaxis protein